MLKKIQLALMFILIILAFFPASSAAAEYEWTSVVDSRTLYWGDSVTYKEYVIKADDFNEKGYVYLVLYKNGQLEEHAPLHVGGSIELEDEIRVFVKKVELGKKEGIKGWVYPMEPRVTVQIFMAERKIPEIEITIKTDKDTYDPKKLSESTFTSKIIIQNKGNEDLRNVNVSVNIDSMKLLEGKLKHKYFEIPKGANESIEIKIETPLIWESESFIISSTVSGVDPEGNRYFSTNEKSINIEQMWELKLSKAVSKILYIDQKAYCALIIRNSGLVPLDSVQVFDTIPEKIADNSSGIPYNSTLSLKPGETIKIIEYALIPDKPGIFLIPEASAYYRSPDGKEHRISSGEQECEVVGHYMVLKKSVNSERSVVSGEIIVTLNIENIGNVDASVTVEDKLPDNSILLQGEPSFKGVIKKGSSASLSYTILINEEGVVQFPPAKASSVDMKGYKGTFESNTPHLMLYGSEHEISKEKDTIVTSFSIFSIYVVLIISSVMVMLRMARK
jgi:hypothetical protein